MLCKYQTFGVLDQRKYLFAQVSFYSFDIKTNRDSVVYHGTSRIDINVGPEKYKSVGWKFLMMPHDVATSKLNCIIGVFLSKMCTKCEAVSADIKTRLNCKTCVLLNIKQEPQTDVTLICNHCGVCLNLQMCDPANVEPFSCDNCLWKDDVNKNVL